LSYRRRLRLEGTTLAACGALSALLVLLFGDDATRTPLSTVVQLLVVAVLMATLGVRSVRRSIGRASAVDEPGDGEATPLWQLPVIVAALTLAFGFGVGWDAGLRIGGGCVVVGVAQALLFERMVAAEEATGGGRFFRLPGSSLFTGTRLGRLR
jgi:uncharacterized membrane protein